MPFLLLLLLLVLHVYCTATVVAIATATVAVTATATYIAAGATAGGGYAHPLCPQHYLSSLFPNHFPLNVDAAMKGSINPMRFFGCQVRETMTAAIELSSDGFLQQINEYECIRDLGAGATAEVRADGGFHNYIRERELYNNFA